MLMKLIMANTDLKKEDKMLIEKLGSVMSTTQDITKSIVETRGTLRNNTARTKN